MQYDIAVYLLLILLIPSFHSFDENVVLHDHECKCCSGEGTLKSHKVICAGVERTIKVKMFEKCGCNRCDDGTAGEDSDEPHTEETQT